jgi:mono/diheme cytochrome c family protein
VKRGKHRLTMLSRGVRLAIGSLALCVTSSGAQESLEKGKTGAQLYASHCAACHKSPQSVTKSTEGFVSEHYPVTPESAATIATYLNGLKKPEPPRGRAAKRTNQAKPPEPPPSESKEDESPVQQAVKRLLQAIKPENN